MVRRDEKECGAGFGVGYYIFIFFFFNDTATTEIYTLSLHDALPIWIVPHANSKVDCSYISIKFEFMLVGLFLSRDQPNQIGRAHV